MRMPAISIIVPVYKAEKYIQRCIDSLLSQTFKDFEILLIDDGSPDKSGEICDGYARVDSRVKVFHQENGGVSSARNYGLNKSTGEWIMFVDADDWLNEEALQLCMKNVSNAEFIRFGMNFVYSQSHAVVDKSLNEIWTYDEYLKKVISRETILGVWGGIYKRYLFEKNNIRFNSAYTLGEDWLVLYFLLQNTSKIMLIDQPLYNYNMMNCESAVHNLTKDKAIQLVEVASIICQDCIQRVESISREISECKCDVCKTCIAGLLLKKVKVKTYKILLPYMIKKTLYPSFLEIVRSRQPIKYKLLLLVFGCWTNIYKLI